MDVGPFFALKSAGTTERSSKFPQRIPAECVLVSAEFMQGDASGTLDVSDGDADRGIHAWGFIFPWTAVACVIGQEVDSGGVFGCRERLGATRMSHNRKNNLLGHSGGALGEVATTEQGCFWAPPFRALQTPQSGCLPSLAFQSSEFLGDLAEYLRHSRPENSRPSVPF